MHEPISDQLASKRINEWLPRRKKEWMSAESGLPHLAGTSTVSSAMPGHRTAAALLSMVNTGAQPETTAMSPLRMETETAGMHPGAI